MTLRRRGGLTLDWSVLRDVDGRLHQGARPRVLRRQRLNGQVVARAFGKLVLHFYPFVRVHREQIKRGKRDLQRGPPVAHLRPEAAAGRRQTWRLRATVSGGESRLEIDVRKVGTIEHPFARTHGINHRQLRPRRRMRREISRTQRRHLR